MPQFIYTMQSRRQHPSKFGRMPDFPGGFSPDEIDFGGI
jgi:hypothetical protein